MRESAAVATTRGAYESIKDTPGRVAFVLVLTTLALGPVTACDDPAAPDVRSIVGNWDLIGFSDAGVEAQTTGNWIFRTDGTHSFEGTVTFPGEPPEDISGEGTFEQTGATLELTVGTARSTWTVVVAGNIATLTENEPPPANEIRLRRR